VQRRYQSDRDFVAGGAKKVETRDVRAALTEGLFKATLMFRVDRGLQRATREVARLSWTWREEKQSRRYNKVTLSVLLIRDIRHCNTPK
jgi:hypothetical protein